MSIDYNKAPFPWFGGKRDAAPAIWAALGDVVHYVDPFCGSLAALLLRPHPCNRTYHSETVNDADGFLVNAWRSIQLAPEEAAEWASWPVSEADLHARHLWLLKWAANRNLEALMGDPDWRDPRAAGYWLWGISSWIGSGWCSGKGPWVVGSDGRIEKRGRPGVRRQRPHLSDDGKGVNRPQLREPGVGDEPDFHPMTMPELRLWFRFLSARLRHVRIINGDWRRVCTNGALKILSARNDPGKRVGAFLDPPYSMDVRADCYSVDSPGLSADVREWCAANGDKPWLRIVLAGFEGEGHESLEGLGWRAVEWFKSGFLKGGYAQQSAGGGNQRRERLWLSPHCADEADRVEEQGRLF